ncbi:SRPBCC family protein [Loktanella sp. SALINAS62]|uniref:SRPBCC family protein n=1 Tax=Loktanella sp. SALINAS62 TaxID=2706124 RepID=UPI0020130855|nr:SRPBCC family protein [Loktanella sp. SALINAS62]MBS1301227.1 SRPBCC family protein [Loktanella sp. SALINAS62]
MTAAHDLTFTRTLSATPAQVWRCWTEPDLLMQWFTPRPVTTTSADIDARPGGIFRTVMQVPDHGEMAGAAGCFLVADPERQLIWTNALGPGFRPNALGDGPMDFALTARIDMAPAPGGCTYTATCTHATPQAAQTHADMGFHDGWGAATTQLEALARRL